MPEARLLTPEEVADRLAVTADQVKYLRKVKALPFVKAGYRTVRFRPRDVEAFIARGGVRD